MESLQLPGSPTVEWVAQLQQALLASASQHPAATAQVLPPGVFAGIIARATALVKQEPTLLTVRGWVGQGSCVAPTPLAPSVLTGPHPSMPTCTPTAAPGGQPAARDGGGRHARAVPRPVQAAGAVWSAQ
jgi:hypothetical protein